MPKTAAFYKVHFGFVEIANEDGRLIELEAKNGRGCRLIILQASKGHRMGQSAVKIVFDVEDIAAFCDEKLAAGLKFGSIHKADGYEFSNVRDPGGNPIQVSSRSFCKG